MKFSVLASGSKGNSLLINSGESYVLIDCGLSLRELEKRLAVHGLTTSSLSAVIVTHEHSDHILGIKSLCSSRNLPLFVSEKVFQNDKHLQEISLHQIFFFCPEEAFEIGKLSFDPFRVSHDAAETVGFNVWEGDKSLTLMTDIGEYTDYTLAKVENSDALIIEANHDEGLLWSCGYPWHTKERIAGPKGHLGNEYTTKFIKDLCKRKKNKTHGLKYLGAAHISENSNTEELALSALVNGIGEDAETPKYFVAKQREVSPLFVL